MNTKEDIGVYSSNYRAAGSIFLSSKTGNILLNFRSTDVSYPNTWSFWGGMVRPSELLFEGLIRELKEEIGFLPKIQSMLPLDVTRSTDGNFDYFTVLTVVDYEFIPKLNRESSGYGWFNIGYWPEPIHPGAKKLLSNSYTVENLNWAWKNYS